MNKTINNNFLILYSFISIFNTGINEAMMGIIFPEIEKKYKIKKQILSLIFLFMAIGNFLSLFFSSYLIKKIKLIKLIIIINFFRSLNFLLIFIWGKYINTFYLIYIYMIIAGFTSSFLEITYNIIVSNNNKKSIILFNALHIFHGLGAMIGPIISNQIIKYHWYYIYLVEFCITFLLFIYLLIIYINTSNENLNNFSKEEVETKKNNEGDVSLIKMFKKPIIIFIPLFLMFYLGLDLSLGNWFYTYLIEYIKGEKTDMSFVISIFWVNQLISEIILIVISYFSKLKNLNIISISIFIIISWICLIFIHYNKDTTMVSILFCIIGFCLGPIHPTVLSIVNDKFNKNQSLLIKSITICSTIPYLGLSIFPFICGMIIDNYGIKRLIILCITFLFVMSICFLAFMVCLFHERIQKYIKSPSFKNIK